MNRKKVYAGARATVAWCLFAVFCAAPLTGCDRSAASYRPEYRPPPRESAAFVVGAPPLRHPKRLHEEFAPLAEFFAATAPGQPFTLEASSDYRQFDGKLGAGLFDFAVLNSYQVVLDARRGYRCFARIEKMDEERAIILARKDSGIGAVRGLRGKSAAFPGVSAMAATLITQKYLQSQGLSPGRDLDIHYVGSQDSVILSVQRRYAGAGCCRLSAWRELAAERPELGQELSPLWQSDPLPGDYVAARAGVSTELLRRVAAALYTMDGHPQGRGILARMGIRRFVPATNEDCQAPREFLRDFSATVHPIAH